MSVHRYCLLGLPRCGSQYISGAINTTFAGNMQNLAEPFSRGHTYNIVQKNNFLYVSSVFPKFTSYKRSYGDQLLQKIALKSNYRIIRMT